MAAAEQEYLRKELVKAFLELKVSKETELTFLNDLKINGRLVPLLREYRYGELQRDVETMYRLYGNMMEYKDDLIDILNNQLEDAAIQDARALSHHYDILSELVDCFNYKAEKARKQFKNQREALHRKFEKERDEIQSKHTQEMKEIDEAESAKTAEFEDKMKKLLEKYKSMSNEVKEKAVDEKQHLKARMEPQKEKLMDSIIETHDNYLKMTSDRRRLHEELKAKDDKHADEIKRTLQKILSVTDNIKKLEKKVNDANDESCVRNFPLRQERDRLKKQKMEMLTALRISTQKGREALKILAKHTEKPLSYLRQLVKKAEEILRIRESYSKLELEEEKIHPFYKSHLSPEESKLTQRTDAFRLSKFPDLEDTKEYYKLEKYFKLYNKVQLDNYILERELEGFNVKNQQLRSSLKKYFDDIQVDKNILQDATLASLAIAGTPSGTNPFCEECQ